MLLIKNNKGGALLLALIILTAAFLFGTTLLHIAMADNNHSVYQNKKNQAHFLARSGAQAFADYIVDNPDDLTTSQIDALITDILNTSGGKSAPTKLRKTDTNYFQIQLQRSGDELLIQSTGYVDQVEDTVSLLLRKNISNFPPLDMAVFSMGSMSLPNGTIYGNVGTNSESPGSVAFSGGPDRIHGQLTLGPAAGEDTVSCAYGDINTFIKDPNPLSNLAKYREYPDPVFPAFPFIATPANVVSQKKTDNNAINTDTYFTGGIEAGTAGPLIINGSSGHRTIQASNFTISNSGSVVINNTGNGTLNIVVDDSFTISNNTKMTINIGNGDVNILTDTLKMNPGTMIVNRTGDGKLKIYVSNRLLLQSSSKINVNASGVKNNPEWAELYYAGSESVHLGDDLDIAAFIQFDKAPLTIDNGGNILGNLVTGGNYLSIKGGSDADVKMIYAPRANVIVSEGGHIKGAIVSNTFTMSGGSIITFSEPGFDPGLIDPSLDPNYQIVLWQ